MPRYSTLRQYTDNQGSIRLVGDLVTLDVVQAIPLCKNGYLTPYAETPAVTVDERLDAHDVDISELQGQMVHVGVHLSTTLSF